jgi:hypothetical protein
MALIAHELAHVKRHDYLVNLLQTLVEILGFYHPAVWWISRQIRNERENCCDDIAVAVLHNRINYARALLSMEELRHRQYALAVTAGGGMLSQRVGRMIGKNIAPRPRGWIPAAALFAVMLLLGSHMALRAQTHCAALQKDNIQSYTVNRNVSMFPENDFSTPQAACAAINRVSLTGNTDRWKEVSIERIADRLDSESHAGTMSMEPEWSQVLLNAQILEVRIWNNEKAMVVARLPQSYSSKPIRKPLDIRHLERRDSRWLNAGNDRRDTIQECDRLFSTIIDHVRRQGYVDLSEKSSFEIEHVQAALKQVYDNPLIIEQTAADFFEAIRTADYHLFLTSQERDVWKRFPISDSYQTYTDFPALVQWICSTFQANPIVSVTFPQVRVSMDKWPSVDYVIRLKDGAVIPGTLRFDYCIQKRTMRPDKGYWRGVQGVDWHLQDTPIQDSF